MSEVALKSLTVLLRSSQSIEEVLRKDMQKYGLNMTEFAVLELLYHKGEQPIQKIGEKILITSGSITYVVDKLEKKGFAERIACPTDRRVTFAAITESGKQFMDEIFPQHEKKVEDIFAVLDETQQQQFIEVAKLIGFHAKDLLNVKA
ncbi:MarR family winged helix-turn-helix transcriptional regulator [Kurthia huakuii]|uniref:MarR family winged helix-turn-helix transcriptional regulator n=1 Tax=Kurthia huakuii TaxID=1421019 RepID=UPI0004963AAB|nr:MarR family transcriptional regulator [Kurthia huakuii]MBM7700125.1 MarR family 2-MHQ and catechol resistance regulon transcriptional repressor [Kurthia huakuii]